MSFIEGEAWGSGFVENSSDPHGRITPDKKQIPSANLSESRISSLKKNEG